MAPDDFALGQSLGPRGRHKRKAEDLEHGATLVPHRRGDAHDAEGESRQNQMAQHVAGLDAEAGIEAQERILHPGGREESQFDAYQPGEHQTQPERGRRVPGKESGEPAILPPVTSHRLPHAEPETDGKVEQEDGAAQQQGRRQTFGQERRDRAGVLDGNAEVAVYQAADERSELGAERLVQTVARASAASSAGVSGRTSLARDSGSPGAARIRKKSSVSAIASTATAWSARRSSQPLIGNPTTPAASARMMPA